MIETVSVACLLAASAIAHAADGDIRVSAQTEGAEVRIEASAILRAPLAIVWQTLTDYDHLESFIPGMTRSRVVDRRGVAAIVEQVGQARFLFFSYPIVVTVSSEEYPPYSIRIHVLKGNLRRLDGGYQIVPRADGESELIWKGVIEPDSFLPAFIARPVLRTVVGAQFSGMVSEIRRRSAASNQ